MFIDSHTHIEKPDSDISVINSYPDQELPYMESKMISCGIHPWYINKNNISSDLQKIKDLCRERKIVAVGECGLDKKIENMANQKQVFEQQIALSEEFKLPLIIHSVKTHHHILQLKKQLNAKQTWIIHGYNGSVQTAQQFIDKEIFLSFGENIISHPEKMKKILNQIDTNFILFETDNNKIGIQEIYKNAAMLLGIELSILENRIEQNFKRAFNRWIG